MAEPPFKRSSSSSEAEEKEFVPKELPYLYEKELIENSNRHIRLVHEFGPSHKVYPLESKFYAKHEQHPPDYSGYLKALQAEKMYHSRWFTSGHPRLESQVYGWAQRDHSPRTLHAINFISAPKQRCEMTAFGEALIPKRITERPVFNGLRFFVR